MTRGLVQGIAVIMAVANASLWVLATRWERPGSTAELTARLGPPAVIRYGGDLVQVAPLIYPLIVVVVPGWAYEGPWNWNTGLDPVLQIAGLGLWAVGLGMAVWAARVIRTYLAVEGVALGHQLVTHGPYRYVRHPVYTSEISIAVGTALIFSSYAMLAIAALSVATHVWWAVAEEQALGTDENLGDAYVAYASRTGRFVPKVLRAKRRTPA